jgi:trimethylamine--corrinoid protein Co-methyltransferase
MKTMVMPYSEPEGKAFALEMNFYYNLPAFSTGGCSDSKLLDEQAIMEASLSLISATLRGGNMIHDLGYLESGLTGSLELLVICDEAVSWLKTFMQGLEISEDTLAMDLIHQHALKGDFLGTKHTLQHVRENWGPQLVDRHNYDQWMAKGGLSMHERAAAKIDQILSEEVRRILPPDVERRIKRISDKVATAHMK